MSPYDRETYATIGAFGTALIVGTLAVAGGIAFGVLRMLELELLFLGTYVTMWAMARLTTRPLRRPAPAPATAPDPDAED